jgi:ubiquinol-cytochrome c reductase cytochrome b subunit
VDDHGHPIPLEYQGARVPKRMNQLGSAGSPVPGSIFRPDPSEQTRALEQARQKAAAGTGTRTTTVTGDDRKPAGLPSQPRD